MLDQHLLSMRSCSGQIGLVGFESDFGTCTKNVCCLLAWLSFGRRNLQPSQSYEINFGRIHESNSIIPCCQEIQDVISDSNQIQMCSLIESFYTYTKRWQGKTSRKDPLT